MNTKELKVGDKVLRVERGGWGPNRYYEAIIAKVSPSGRVAVGTKIFNPDGHERGDRWHGDWLEPFDQKVLDRQNRERNIRSKRAMLEDYRLWRTELDDELILKIAAMVETAKAEAR